MFIGTVDDALAAMLRARVPLGEDEIEISFEPPTPDWAARLARPTVSLHLTRVGRGAELVRLPQRRFDANGRPERRGAQGNTAELRYVLTVWAADAAVEHRLLGRIVSLLASTPSVPAEFVSTQAPIAVSLDAIETGTAAAFTTVGPGKAVAVFTVVAAVDVIESDEAPDVRPMRPVAVEDR